MEKRRQEKRMEMEGPRTDERGIIDRLGVIGVWPIRRLRGRHSALHCPHRHTDTRATSRLAAAIPWISSACQGARVAKIPHRSAR